MKLNKLLAVILVVAMSMSMLAACGTKDKQTSAYPGTTEAKAITVNITSEPPELFTVKTSDTTSFIVIRHMIENLVMLDENDEVKPGVAKDWTISDDGLVYTFNLREGMKWSNGEPVTAHDFVFAWTSLLNPEFAAYYSYFGYILKNGLAYNNGEVAKEEVGVKALSDYVLEVTLENPTAYALDSFAFGVFAPVNEKGYNEFGDSYGKDADKIVTNGAFKIASWEHENKLVLEKNQDFYDAKNIELEKITMVMINDNTAAMNAFKAGDVDMINLRGDQLQMMQAEEYPVASYGDGATFYLLYNLDNEEFANANLRRALTYAVDKESFVKNVQKNNSMAAVAFTAPAVNGKDKKFYEEVGELVPTLNVDKAKEYYAKALEELGTDTVNITMICDDTDVAKDNAAFVQEQLRVNLGIEIKIDSMPFKSRIDKMQNKDFQMVFAGWGPDYNDPMTFLDMFETGGGNNHGNFSNAAYDALLNKVRTEGDVDVRHGYLVELEELLMNELPIGPIYWRYRDYVVSGKIKSGVVRTAFQDMNFRNVKLAK